jgi:hypothetical protein
VATGFQCPTCGKCVPAALATGEKAYCPFCGQAVVMTQPATPAQNPPSDFVFCAKCGTRNDGNNYKCVACGFVLRGGPVHIVTSEDTMGGLIPAKNPAALWSYYLGVFSLIPCAGLFIGVAAIIMGIKGIRKAKAEPQAKGRVHAIVGLVLGATCVCFNLLGVGLVAFGAVCKH